MTARIAANLAQRGHLTAAAIDRMLAAGREGATGNRLIECGYDAGDFL